MELGHQNIVKSNTWTAILKGGDEDAKWRADKADKGGKEQVDGTVPQQTSLFFGYYRFGNRVECPVYTG
jgi:hypothetical protein